MNNLPDNNETGKLSVFEKLGFGAGDLASNLLFQTFNMFLLFFYTDVVGLSAKSIFYIFLVAKLWDMINDPIMGAIADRTHTRWGRYRPYILGLALPYGLSAYLLFIIPDLPNLAKIFYCGATYIFATMMYTGVNIPYSALMGVITPNIEERTSVSQYRFFMAFIGGWLISTFTLPLVKVFGNKPDSPTFNPEIGYDPVAGYPTTMMVFGILSVLLLGATFFSTKERVKPVSTAKTPFKDDVKDLIKNWPWLVLFVSAVLFLTNIAIRNGSMLYFLKYCVVGSDKLLFTVNFGFFDLEVTRTVLFMSAGSIFTILGVLPVKLLTDRFGKRSYFIFSLVIQGLLAGLIFFIPRDMYVAILVVNLVVSFFGAQAPTIMFAMYADVADYSEWKTSRRATGLIIATILFAFKGGLWLGGQILTGILAWIGYSKMTAAQPDIQIWLVLLFTWIPGVFAILSGAIVFKYPITDKIMYTVQSELQKRKLGVV